LNLTVNYENRPTFAEVKKEKKKEREGETKVHKKVARFFRDKTYNI